MVRPAPSEQRARRRIRALLIGAGAALVVWGASAAGWLEAAELWSWDARARLFARPAPAAVPIRLVVVDDRSLRWVEEELGFSRPWPRHLHARLVRFCRRAGARALIFDDLGFTEERGDAPRDQLLASSLRAAAPSTVALAVQTGDDFAGWPESAPPVPFRLAGLEDWRAWAGGDPFSRRGVLLPVAPLAAAAPILGHVDGVVDGGPVVRFIEPLRVVAGRPLPFLALAAAAAVAGDVDLRLGAGWLELAGRRLPLDRRGRAVLRYRAPLAEHGGHLYPALAAAYLLAAAYHPDGEAGRAAAAEIRDRYVIFGIGASGLGDDVFTPTAGLTRGLEIHATALDNLLGGDFMRPAGSGSTAALSLALALAAAVTAIDLRRLRAMPAAAVAAYGAGWWLRLAEPAAAAVLALAGGTVYGYVTEGRRRRFLQRAFSHYLSPAVIERLVEDPSRLELGGERRELSIFFSDLAGFSTLAEGLDPRRLAALLNDYLSAMTELILAEEGTLDKYEGDAIVAFWNAPLDQDDHARRACAAALACQERLAAMAEHFRTRTGGVPLRARIGVHSGEVVVGNLGSRTRFDYTVLGDAANLASRLEGANKAFGSKILVSEATWRATAGAFHGREVGEVVVVGRRQPVRVFEPLAPAAAPPPPWLADWQSALAALRRGELEDARRRFAARPQDPVARAYAERLAALLAEDEPTWDGVWHLDQK